MQGRSFFLCNVFCYTSCMDIIQISHYLDQLLDIHNIKDASRAVNGLQVESTGDIKKVGLAVDACQATIDMAIEQDCDMMFVHHGLFWGGLQPVRGAHYKKLARMVEANLGLYSAHIPLDVHPVLGNNRQLADVIGLDTLQEFALNDGQYIGLRGTIAPKTGHELGGMLSEALHTNVRVIGDGVIRSVGLVTGGAGKLLGEAIREGLDCFITGEGDAYQFHDAMENGCILMFAGHYATETGGVKAVGRHLEEQFGLETTFLDYPTGL